jgi:hypothetical protein
MKIFKVHKKLLGILSTLVGASVAIQLFVPILANYPQSKLLLLSYDPSYAYLLNAGNILIGKPIFHVDHPGTPVQLLFALVILICFIPFSTQKTLPSFIVEFSDQLIVIYQIAFLIISAVFLAIVFKLVVKKSNVLSGLIFAHSFIFAFGTYANLSYWTSATPDSMAIFLSAMIVTITFVANIPNKPRIFLLGFLLSTILMTKLNTIPFLIFILVVCKNRNDFFIFLKSFSFTSAIWAILMYENFFRFVKWSANLFLHSGTHGSNSSFLNLDEMLRSLSYTKYILVPLLLLTAIVGRNLVYQKMQLRKALRENEILLFFVICLGYISVLRTGVIHYFLPFWPIVGFLFANYFSTFWRSHQEKSLDLVSHVCKKKLTHRNEFSRFDFFLSSTLTIYLLLLLTDNIHYIKASYVFSYLTLLSIGIFLFTPVIINSIAGKFSIIAHLTVYSVLVSILIFLPLRNEFKLLNQSRSLEVSNNELVEDLGDRLIVLVGDSTPTKSAALKHGNGFAGGTFTREIDAFFRQTVYLQEISRDFANTRIFNLVDSDNKSIACENLHSGQFNSVMLILTRNPLGSQIDTELKGIKIMETSFSKFSIVSDFGDYRVIRLSDFSCT